MSNNKIDKNTVPEGFTINLALVDAWPVVAFGISMVIAGWLFHSVLFLLGALLCLYAGVTKVTWKIIVALKKKNIWWLFMQMRIVTPIGLLLMIIGVFAGGVEVTGAGIAEAITSFPAIIFFGIGAVGILLMMIFAFTLDSTDVRSNWIEQCTNGIAQTAILIGLILLL